MEDYIKADLQQLACDTAKTLGKSLATGAATKVGNIAMGALLSVMGYQSPEQKFQEYATQALEEIKKEISLQFSSLSAQISAVNQEIKNLRTQLDLVEQNIITASDRNELGMRMSTINQYIAKIDQMYENYISAVTESNMDISREQTKQLIMEIERADLPTIIRYISSELCHTSASSQVPLITLFDRCLTNVYPFAHQSTPKTYLFANYMQGELTKATTLYIEYLNYQQVIYEEDPAKVMALQKSGEQMKSDYQMYLNEIQALLPSAQDAMYLVDLHVSGYKQSPLRGYTLVSNSNGATFGFCPSLRLPLYNAVSKDSYTGDKYYCDPEDTSVSAGLDMFQKLDETRRAYAPFLTNLEFLNQNLGLNIQTEYFGCTDFRSGYYLNINSLNGGEYCGGSGNDIVITWGVREISQFYASYSLGYHVD